MTEQMLNFKQPTQARKSQKQQYLEQKRPNSSFEANVIRQQQSHIEYPKPQIKVIPQKQIKVV